MKLSNLRCCSVHYFVGNVVGRGRTISDLRRGTIHYCASIILDLKCWRRPTWRIMMEGMFKTLMDGFLQISWGKDWWFWGEGNEHNFLGESKVLVRKYFAMERLVMKVLTVKLLRRLWKCSEMIRGALRRRFKVLGWDFEDKVKHTSNSDDDLENVLVEKKFLDQGNFYRRFDYWRKRSRAQNFVDYCRFICRTDL